MLKNMLCLSLAVLAMSALPARAAEPMSFIHPPPENLNDQRHTYYWELLEAALQANKAKYGDYKVVSYGTPMNFQRAAAEVEAGEKGRVNIVARATNLDLEARMRAIPIPLDKGLLGYRLFLIMPPTQAKLDAVKSLDELKKFSIGQASPWTDVKILEANQFNVVIADNYEGLFQMLGINRFDLFSRGVNEIYSEWEGHRAQVPGLSIEKNMVLAYPMPRYFFVPRNKDGEKMAERIEDGLRRLARSGEFERRYLTYKKLVLADINLSGRRVFRLANPQLSDKAPSLTDKLWWDDLGAELAPRK
ncbi:hypothetical protein Q9Q94_07725 [Uliginosibacterium sp. 31-16]|uniref:hypothetical protein n=1 Tax=Uliginosibacterium sp. 31-16 TaxID=3068315 RepID=UPI00273E7BB4|nr:hypothetical protein [Uliginosibacterium sp. 31-16]MDP5239415.1 hypothetical protein [Uliginosibacterium sp. 31-16]